MTANYSKSCLGYLNKLVDQYKKYSSLFFDADYSAFAKEVETNP